MMKKNGDRWWLIGIAWEMGYLIALPLVGSAFLGRFVDSIAHTAPLFLIIGVLSAIALSTVLVVRKTSDVMHRAAHEEGEEEIPSSSRETAASKKEGDDTSDPKRQ